MVFSIGPLLSGGPLLSELYGSVVLTFESVDKILRCDHSNETSSAVLFHGTICLSNEYFTK